MTEMPERPARPFTTDAAAPTDANAATTPATSPETSGAAAPTADQAGPAGEPLVTPDVVRVALRRVKDPELNLNIIDLGLVYDIRVDGANVTIDMSLTSPGCPSGAEIMGDAEQRVREIPEVEDVTMNLVWSPMWSPERIEPRVRAYLGF